MLLSSSHSSSYGATLFHAQKLLNQLIHPLLRLTFVLLVLLLPMADLLAQGVIFEMESTDHSGEALIVRNIEVLVDQNNILIPITSDAGMEMEGRMIFESQKGEHGQITVVDDQKKSYFVMDDDLMNQMSQQMSGIQKQMQEMMDQLPKEQREALEKAQQNPSHPMYQGQQSPSEISMKPTGKSGQKQGYPCMEYEVKRDGQLIRTVWITDWNKVKNAQAAAGTFEKMGKFFEAFMEKIPQMPGMQMMRQNPYQEMNFDKGFPVESTTFDENGEVLEKSILKNVSSGSIAPARFKVPDDYSPVRMGTQ